MKTDIVWGVPLHCYVVLFPSCVFFCLPTVSTLRVTCGLMVQGQEEGKEVSAETFLSDSLFTDSASFCW